MSNRFFVVVNPAAGAGKSAQRWERLRRRMEELCASLQIAYTDGPGRAIALARDAARNCDVVVAVGGDGTVSEVANGLLESGCKTPLGILPVGTANDGASQFGIKSVEHAFEALAGGVQRFFDTIEVRYGGGQSAQTRYALMFAAAGFGAELLARTTAGVKRVFGPKLCYAVGFIRALWHYRQSRLEARSEHGVFKGWLFHVCAGNTEFAGGRSMRLSPGARPDDGKLNLCIIDRLNRLEALVHLPKLFHGTHPGHPKVRYFSGDRLEVDSNPQAPLAIDGDVVGFTPAKLTIRPGSLPVLVPLSPGA